MSDTSNMKFSMRAEKTTRNKDDLRVIIAGTLFCIFMIMMQKPIYWMYDSVYAERPMISATVEVKAIAGRERPMIAYDADARQNVRGTWVASVYEAEGDQARLFSRRGDGNYDSQTISDEPQLWTWGSFFDNENADYVIPPVPDRPFIVCVRYDVLAVDSNFNETTNNYCSEPFDPAVMEELP